jgi:tetratricopeptide (TPR) repeat protein
VELNITDTSKKHEEFLNKFYARSVAVVHFIMSDSERREQLLQYLYLIKIGVTVDKAFGIAFKTTFSELDKKINTYINRNTLIGITYKTGKDGLEFPEVKYNKNSLTKEETFGYLFQKITMLSQYLGRENYVKFHNDLEKKYPGLIYNMLQKQLAEKPNDINLLMSLASTYEMMAWHKQSIDLFERLLVLDGSHQRALNNFAWLLATVPDMELRNPERAVELAKRAVALKKLPYCLDTLAEAYYASGSFEMAIDTIKEAISLDGENEYYKKQLEKFTAAGKKS